MKRFIPENGIFSGRELTVSERIAIAIPIGFAAGLAAWIAFHLVPDMVARDFTYPWRGARALLAGQNPYDVIRPVGPPPNDHWFMYPLTAPIAAMPLAWLPARLAGAIFAALGASFLAFALSRTGGLRSLLLFFSPSLGFAIVLGQWPPLIIAAALVIPLSWALVCKPTIGLPLFLYRPSWGAAALCTAFLLLSVLVLPTWPLDWWRNARALEGHYIPALRPFGFLALAALLRWRKPEARLVAGMSLVPQNLYFYDQLPLLLAATTTTRRLLLVLLSWIAWLMAHAGCETPWYCGREAEPWVILLIYVPAAVMTLLGPGEVAWFRRIARHRQEGL